jgi:hypothetical protein
MTKISRTFISGRMNKLVDERLLPETEYIDGMNIRMGSTEKSEMGVIENTKGNLPLTSLRYIDGTELSTSARCIGAIEDSANETLYWFVHDDNFSLGATGVLDLIVSFNILTNILTYHVISIDDGSGVSSTLNFNSKYLITGVNIINNLLFFTDGYNQPRCINTTRNYPNPVSFIDSISAEELLVIKRPPVESPVVQPIVTSGQQNFMDTRFISFAYRYRYIDGEYSATSQWSQISFVPNPFSFSLNSMLNEGMVNFCNTAIVNYNTGSSLVVGIDLLFKESASNIVKVIEKLDKADLGLADDTVYQFTFSNSKIFTILGTNEVLRLYDNVPRLAVAQTIMGNRLMYGNYQEGYDLIDKNGNPVKFEYTTSLISETIGQSDVDTSFSTGSYDIDTPESIPNSVISIDLTGFSLVAGAAISVEMSIAHESFSGDLPFPAETTDNISIDFSFFLTQNYSSVYQMATSPEFQSAVGTTLNIKPVYSAVPGTETSCDGITFTDLINCVLPNNLDALQKFRSGVDSVNTPVSIITSPASSVIQFQLIAMNYVNNTVTPTQNVFEYYSFTFANATFQEIANPQSLHSNRGYEIGIVYMDMYNRSTTALVSPNNTEHIPCGFSPNKNGIRVTIPFTQVAPAWATRYKFVIKPDAEKYEIIYSNLFFTDENTNEVWFYLEGENARKVEIGDRYIVKADTSGPLLNCAYATVLDKAVQAADFITPIEDVTIPAGVYMKMNPNSFSAVVDPNSTVAPGGKQACAPKGGNYSYLAYPMNKFNTVTGLYEDYTVPAGSRIKLYIEWSRAGVGGSCEQRGYVLEQNYVSSADYDNMYDWFIGENIESSLDNGTSTDGITSVEFIPTIGPVAPYYNFDIVYLRFNRNLATLQLTLEMSTGKSCTGGQPNRRKYCVYADIEVFRALDTIIFETEPLDASPDIFFENNLSFSIDADGNHSGNVQDQDIATNTPAIVDTMFFNCFSFGNGAESYKIRDSLIGREFTLGERVTAVSAQDYKKANRFADITYSGIYNAESNVNKLNEFNLGVLNYKTLETSFGPIYILDGRETDVLVLQEDKISYVLESKNLLSSSAGGGAIASIPEVLGTQIARTEKYGISFNPESYVQWGFNRFFTDVKRGVVLQLMGDSYSNDQLKIVSDSGMRTWFRDEFNASFSTQKLGGFDPYMNEYVLSTNDITLPDELKCVDCGILKTFTLSTLEGETGEFSYCVDLGPLVGNSSVYWTVNSISVDGEFNVDVIYDGTTISSGPETTSGSLTFEKDSISVQSASIVITYTGDMSLTFLADCCNAEELTIIEVVLTSNSDLGQSIHTEFRYTSGTFIGPLQSSLVTFATGTSPIVSRYNSITGSVGTGSFPPEGSTMTLQTNQIVPDTFVFNPSSDKFKYARTNTLYPNTTVGINNLLSVASTATPITGVAPTYSASFTVPLSVDGNKLYLIWDFREATSVELCYTPAETVDPQKDVCCNCVGT